MTPTNEQYAIAAFCEAVANNIPHQIVWCALFNSSTGKQLDQNIQAAIKAADWLAEITKR